MGAAVSLRMRRPTETRLRRAFADVLTAVLATSAGGLAVAGAGGCGGGTLTSVGGSTSSSGNPSELTSLCPKVGTPYPTTTFLAGLRASPPLDGAVRRTETAFRTYSGQGGIKNGGPNAVGDDWSATDGEKVGAICAKASAPAACRDKVHGFRLLPATLDACSAAYPATGYPNDVSCRSTYILYTRGDEIGVARNDAETKALIGTFDTVDEALWVANNAGYTISCSSDTAGTTPQPPDSQFRATSDGGWDLHLVEFQNCGPDMFSVAVHVDYAGNLTEVSREKLAIKPQCSVAGRRPAGLAAEGDAPSGGDRDPVGEHFARMATLEAASVVSFRRLHRHLASLGAPPALLARVHKAARDEVRHARATGKLARKYGVTPAAPKIAAEEGTPSLFDLARENAREGCVRETYGALVAHLQMTRAADADVRACMTAIADEETEHAALSWDLAAWLEAQLDGRERALLATERSLAFATLARDLSSPVDARVQRLSGVPRQEDALAMLAGLGPVLLHAA